MKTKGVVAIVLVALGSLGTGYWLGYHVRVAAASELSKRSQSESADAARVGSKSSPLGTTASASTGSEEARLSLAEIEEKLTSSKDWIRDKDWEKIMSSLGPADFPGLLAAAEKNPSRSIRDGMRIVLLGRWGSGEP